MNRAMLGRMVLPAPGPLPAGTVLLAVADDLTEAVAAVQAGADAVEFTAGAAEAVTVFLARYPDIPVCAALPGAQLVRDPGLAQLTGAWLVCRDAAAAQRDGVAADRMLVEVPPAQIPALVQAGLAPLVDADRSAELAARDANPVPAPGPPPAPGAGPAPGSGPGSGAGIVDASGIVAIAALSAWLGARAVRTRYPAPVRRALDMTASIQGTRPPALTVRGLA
jgi:dihydropteroate synthase